MVVAPAEFIRELKRRVYPNGEVQLMRMVKPSLDYLEDVVNGRLQRDPVRVQVCERTLTRFGYDMPQRLEISVGTTAFERVQKAIVVRDLIEADSEEVNPWDEILEEPEDEEQPALPPAATSHPSAEPAMHTMNSPDEKGQIHRQDQRVTRARQHIRRR